MHPGTAARRTVLALAVAAAPALTGCGLLDGGSRLEESLEYLPAGTTAVEFVDRVAVAEHLGVDDVEGDPSGSELDDYLTALAESAYGTELARWIRPMVENDAAFSDLDIEWQAVGRGMDEPATVWKLADDVDLDEVADDMADAGWEESGSDDVRRLTIDLGSAGATTGLAGDRYPVAALHDVAVVPDEHLIVRGGDETVDAVMDDEDSLADTGDFDDLLDRADDPDALAYAVMRTGDAACAPFAGGRATPEQAEAAIGDLGTASGTAFFAVIDEEAPGVGVLLYDDAEAAEADADARETYLDGWQTSYGLELDLDVSTDDEAVLVESDPDDARQVVQALYRGEGPLVCAPDE